MEAIAYHQLEITIQMAEITIQMLAIASVERIFCLATAQWLTQHQKTHLSQIRYQTCRIVMVISKWSHLHS